MQFSIIPVDGQNIATVSTLHVAPSQAGMVETVAECIKEASQLSLWRPVAICADGVQSPRGLLIQEEMEPLKHNRSRCTGEICLRSPWGTAVTMMDGMASRSGAVTSTGWWRIFSYAAIHQFGL